MQAWADVPLSLATGDISVVMQEPGSEHLSFPSKTYNHMAAGSAIVAYTAGHSDLAEFVRDNGIGIVVKPLGSAGLAAAIRWLAEDASQLDLFRRRAREVAESSYSIPAVAERFRDVLKACVPEWDTTR